MVRSNTATAIQKMSDGTEIIIPGKNFLFNVNVLSGVFWGKTVGQNIKKDGRSDFFICVKFTKIRVTAYEYLTKNAFFYIILMICVCKRQYHPMGAWKIFVPTFFGKGDFFSYGQGSKIRWKLTRGR